MGDVAMQWFTSHTRVAPGGGGAATGGAMLVRYWLVGVCIGCLWRQNLQVSYGIGIALNNVSLLHAPDVYAPHPTALSSALPISASQIVHTPTQHNHSTFPH